MGDGIDGKAISAEGPSLLGLGHAALGGDADFEAAAFEWAGEAGRVMVAAPVAVVGMFGEHVGFARDR